MIWSNNSESLFKLVFARFSGIGVGNGVGVGVTVAVGVASTVGVGTGFSSCLLHPIINIRASNKVKAYSFFFIIACPPKALFCGKVKKYFIFIIVKCQPFELSFFIGI